ncbi:hypothetical protein L211DRAFT_785250 [Terfezia boudieri ATCC MYA-4762]|uniref:Nudix hydrolase domain-containing protein n=1 Tax=Terfezia boudieri ATCC MYA-4762 TaxID=1051890 RepID=A0A3N4LRI5_9PEZI|nr:hypothetical protein L211DRAFT_785250 [Terfezia boudieri ATCC MYA-4762]
MPEETRTPKVLSKDIFQSTIDCEKSKWVNVVKITYKNQLGKDATWESAERTTRPPGVEIDGVGIIAVLEGEKDEPARILLQKQFRPPVGRMCIEVPAGLIDAGETPEECALRELQEETGYYGQIVKTEDGMERSCMMYNDPGFCNTNLHFIHVKVDLMDPRNKKPEPKLEENEFIECFTVPLRDMWQICRDLEKEGYAIDARVGTLAEGFEIMKKWSHIW